MARYPNATWRGSPNVGGTPTRPARGFVVHVEVGTEAGTNACFQNPSFQASAHFGVAADGSIDQWVDTDQEAWAEVAGNPGWISAETEGTPDTALTEAQVTALGRLAAWCHALYGYPLQACDHDGTGITTHAHYPSGTPDAAWGGHPCPGALRSAQIPNILAAAQAATSTQGAAMGVYHLTATIIDPARPIDHLGRHPFWGVDAHGQTYAFNGARPIPSPIKPGAHDDVCGLQYLPSADLLVAFCDDGHPEAGEPGGYGASTFDIRPSP